MSHEQIWAPWRLDYIASASTPAEEGCFLCRYAAQANDAENFVLSRGPRVLTVLNRFPYNNGHLLVAPLAHKAELHELDDDEQLDCMRQLRDLTVVMRRVLRAEGFNVGLNLGKVAGAGVPGHLHWHLVPRWNGDTNFMPVVADVKVIPQSLEALYEVLLSELSSSPSA